MPRRKRKLPDVDTTLVQPPKLPDARTVQTLDFPFNTDELRSVRIAMSLWAESRKPRLTWQGWQYIGYALELGRLYADRTKQPKKSFGLFLKATGFTFINEGLRWSLRKCMSQLEEIKKWHDELPPHIRRTINDPINVWEEFTSGKTFPEKKSKGTAGFHHRDYPTLVEEFELLQGKLDAIEEHRDELLGLLGELRDVVEPQRDSDPVCEEIYQKIIHQRG